MEVPVPLKNMVNFVLILILFFSSDMVTAVEQNYQAQETTDIIQASRSRPQLGSFLNGMYKSRVLPHWFAENNCFWYRNDLRDNKRDFILVDVEKGTRQRAFDHNKLAQSLSKVTQEQYSGEQLPFTDIKFIEDSNTILFNVSETTYKCDLNSYEISLSDTPMPVPEQPQRGFAGQRGLGGQRGQRGGRGTGQTQLNRGQFRGRGGGGRWQRPRHGIGRCTGAGARRN